VRLHGGGARRCGRSKSEMSGCATTVPRSSRVLAVALAHRKQAGPLHGYKQHMMIAIMWIASLTCTQSRAATTAPSSQISRRQLSQPPPPRPHPPCHPPTPTPKPTQQNKLRAMLERQHQQREAQAAMVKAKAKQAKEAKKLARLEDPRDKAERERQQRAGRSSKAFEQGFECSFDSHFASLSVCELAPAALPKPAAAALALPPKPATQQPASDRQPVAAASVAPAYADPAPLRIAPTPAPLKFSWAAVVAQAAAPSNPAPKDETLLVGNAAPTAVVADEAGDLPSCMDQPFGPVSTSAVNNATPVDDRDDSAPAPAVLPTQPRSIDTTNTDDSEDNTSDCITSAADAALEC